jgi:hypothetical protein
MSLYGGYGVSEGKAPAGRGTRCPWGPFGPPRPRTSAPGGPHGQTQRRWFPGTAGKAESVNKAHHVNQYCQRRHLKVAVRGNHKKYRFFPVDFKTHRIQVNRWRGLVEPRHVDVHKWHGVGPICFGDGPVWEQWWPHQLVVGFRKVQCYGTVVAVFLGSDGDVSCCGRCLRLRRTGTTAAQRPSRPPVGEEDVYHCNDPHDCKGHADEVEAGPYFPSRFAHQASRRARWWLSDWLSKKGGASERSPKSYF